MPTPVQPRWLEVRAARLLSAVVEASIDAVGHAVVYERLTDASGIRTLHHLAAGPAQHYEGQLQLVSRALSAGLDEDRLGLAVGRDPAEVTLLGRRSPLGGPEGELIPLPTSNASIAAVPGPPLRPWERDLPLDAHRLSAAVHLGHEPLPAPFDKVALEPGFGPRAVRALALCAEWIVDGAPPDEERLRFALGSAGGEPFGVALPVYDRVIATLEQVLHQAKVATVRVQPMLSLHQALLERSGRGAVIEPERLIAKESRAGLPLVTLGDDVPRNRLPRRPRRTVLRPPETYRPAHPAPRPLPALDGQGDLFAP